MNHIGHGSGVFRWYDLSLIALLIVTSVVFAAWFGLTVLGYDGSLFDFIIYILSGIG